MEIEIDSKKNNPLLNRTEVYFTVKHDGEKTPNREIIRSELADKLNVKKEHIIVDHIDTQFGVQVLSGYAKIYSSSETTKQLEPNYILKRNKLAEDKTKDKKAEKKSGEASAEKPMEVKKEEPVEKKEPQKPATEQQPKEKSDELKPQKDSKPKEESKKEPVKSEEKKE